MLDKQKRSRSEVGIFFPEYNEPIRQEVADKILTLLNFWITYAQIQQLKIEDSEVLITILGLCINDYTSEEIKEKLQEMGIEVPSAFVDRIYLRMKRLIMLILKCEYTYLQLIDEDFEASEEEQRVYDIYKAFSNLPSSINRHTALNVRFAELAKFNPHYVDFLTLFANGRSVAEAIEETGITLHQSTKWSVSESYISAIVRGSPNKTLYKEVEMWTINTFYPLIIKNNSYIELVLKCLLLYVQGNSTDLPRVTEVRRFIELLICSINPHSNLAVNIDSMNLAERTEAISEALNDPLYFMQFREYINKFLLLYSRNGNFDECFEYLSTEKFMRSRKYLNSVFSAAKSVLFSCVLILCYDNSRRLTDDKLKLWLSRNRNSECSTILKILSGVES